MSKHIIKRSDTAMKKTIDIIQAAKAAAPVLAAASPEQKNRTRRVQKS